MASPRRRRFVWRLSEAAGGFPPPRIPGRLGSSESVRVSKEMRIMGILVLIWSSVEWLPALAALSSSSSPPKGRSRRRESAAEPGLPIFPPATPILPPASPSPEAPHSADSSPIKQGNIQRMKPCPWRARGVRCQGWDPGLQQSETWVPLTARGAAPLETNRSVQTSSSAESPVSEPTNPRMRSAGGLVGAGTAGVRGCLWFLKAGATNPHSGSI